MTLNVQRLKDYKARLVVFPRHNNKIKNGDATKAEIAASTLDTSSVNTIPKAADAVTFAPVTEVFINICVTTGQQSSENNIFFAYSSLFTHSDLQELKAFKAYSALRSARADSRLVGVRAKKSKEGKEDAPAEKE